MLKQHQRHLASILGLEPADISCRPVQGGCISEAMRVTVGKRGAADRQLFAKVNQASFESNFRAEWQGLESLRASQTIGVPQPIALEVIGDSSYFVTSWIEQPLHRKDGEFFREFGHRLACLHRATAGDRIGLESDNFLGSARQINTPTATWVDFVAHQRLGFQLRWAVDQRLASADLQSRVACVIDRLDHLLSGRDADTSLIHGDLWSGNFLIDHDRKPVIIDPAIYYGCREAEFGMLRLFGHCPPEFYDAYLETWPLPDGWQHRVDVYTLYHLLNHLNLFGTGYLGDCLRVCESILNR
jgi:fructosamine-3-kinase